MPASIRNLWRRLAFAWKDRGQIAMIAPSLKSPIRTTRGGGVVKKLAGFLAVVFALAALVLWSTDQRAEQCLGQPARVVRGNIEIPWRAAPYSLWPQIKKRGEQPAKKKPQSVMA
jgi:hypothetical protein